MAHHIFMVVENDKANPLRNVNAGLPIRGWAMLWNDEDDADDADVSAWQLTICAPGCVVTLLDEVKRVARAERCPKIQLDVQNRDSILGWDFVSRHDFQLNPRSGFSLDIILDLPEAGPIDLLRPAAEEVSMANVAIAKIDSLMNEAAALICETKNMCDDESPKASPKASPSALEDASPKAASDVPKELLYLRQAGSAL